ncbi:DUF899 family protein [Bacillus timonensis]|nr:DUF899 family protein [Bacillus timonensis]
MTMSNIQQQIEALELEILEKKKQLTQLRKSVQERQVENYELVRSSGEKVTLLELFGDQDELIVIHNMGKSCSYCTMWADGFNGVYQHLVGKASFVLSSPDAPEVQEDFAASRKWQFPIVSVQGSSFTRDVGFIQEDSYHPGVSTFRKDEEGKIYLHAQAQLGPGDDYCVTWHLFDLLPSGASGVKVKRNLNERSPFQLTNNVALGVKDYEKAIPFYRDVLGMKLERTLENETQLSISGTNFFIEESAENNVYFEFAVENIDEVKRALLDNGCEVTKVYHDKSFMIVDPFGLQFHMFEGKK